MASDTLTAQQKIDVFTAIMIRVTVTVVVVWFLYVIRDVVLLFLMSIVVAAALNPLIRWVRRYVHFSPPLIIGVIYVIFFLFVGLLLWSIMPMVSQQFAGLIKQLPELLASLVPASVVGGDAIYADITDKILGAFGSPFSTTVGVLQGVVSFLAMLSMAFYMSLQEDGIKKALMTITPQQHQKYVAGLTDRIQDHFGRWMAGQLVTMVFVGVLYYVILRMLGVPYALALATMGGVLEIVPYFGPILSAIPAVIFGFGVSPIMGVVVAFAYWGVNLVENYFLVPKIMNRAIGLHPVFVILALLIGMHVAGVVGVFLAVPLAGAIGVFLRDVADKRIV